jgi:hypothetical protein
MDEQQQRGFVKSDLMRRLTHVIIAGQIALLLGSMFVAAYFGAVSGTGLADRLLIYIATLMYAVVPLNIALFTIAVPLALLTKDVLPGRWSTVFASAALGGLLYAVPTTAYFLYWLYSVSGDFHGSGSRYTTLRNFPYLFAVGAVYGGICGYCYLYLQERQTGNGAV